MSPYDSGDFKTGFKNGEIIVVRAGWNDQMNEQRDYFGTAYTKRHSRCFGVGADNLTDSKITQKAQ